MPKLFNPTPNDTCFLCGCQAHWISFNSKQMRCVEKITRCTGFVKKAQATRDANTTPEERTAHMKRMSKNGNAKLKKLHSDPKWLATKSEKISESIEQRGGHNGSNNPMFGRTHKKSTKRKQAVKAQNRDPKCYERGTDTKIKNGIATPKELKSAWELYREKVENITTQNWKKHHNRINPNNLPRGQEYELDHKFSKTEGFLNNVPPEVIGHYANLELIPKHKNRSKRTKCSITLTELYEAIKS
jgi:hypothetical protein